MGSEDLGDDEMAARIGGLIRHTLDAAIAEPAHPEMWWNPELLAEDLADEFHEALLLAEKNAWDYRPPDAVVHVLRDINARLDTMAESGDDAMWRAGAVDTHPAWQEIRALARKALQAFEPTDPVAH